MIYWNTDVNAPSCPGEIVAEDGRTILIQTDWDYPGVAGTFGWNLKKLQRCAYVSSLCRVESEDGLVTCDDSDDDPCEHFEDCKPCEHGTDGTIDCPDCGLSASVFIFAALDWLRDNDGAEAEDPGYFD